MQINMIHIHNGSHETANCIMVTCASWIVHRTVPCRAKENRRRTPAQREEERKNVKASLSAVCSDPACH